MNAPYQAALASLGFTPDADLRQIVPFMGRKIRLEHAAGALCDAELYSGSVAALNGAYGQFPVIKTADGFRVHDSFGYCGTRPTLAEAQALFARNERESSAFEYRHNL